MLKQLILTSAFFHTINVVALVLLARLWRHRYSEEPAIRPRTPQMLADLGALGAVATLSAAAIGTLGRLGGFGVIHLMTQWLFAEFFIGLSLAAWWMGRSRVTTHSCLRSWTRGFAVGNGSSR